MDDRLIEQCIITRNKELLKEVLNKPTYLEVFQELLNKINDQLIIHNLEFNKAFGPINYIINIFYDIFHDFDQDLESLLSLVNGFLLELKTKLKTIDSKGEEYHINKHVYNRITSFKKLVFHCSINEDKGCEYDLLCYLISEIKSFVYVESLIKKNPSILKIEKNDISIFEYLTNEYVKFIKKGDLDSHHLDFFRKTICLFLENKFLLVDQGELLRIINKINTNLDEDNQQKQKELVYLRQLIYSFYPDLKINNKINLVTQLTNAPQIHDYVKPTNVYTRLDLRNLDTISIDSSTENKKNEQTIFDDAFTLFKHNEGYVVYIHLADSPSFVFANLALHDDVKNRIFALKHDLRYIPLFNSKFSRDYLSLCPNVDRFAITVACEVDETGKIIGVNFYESIIRNKKAFSSYEVNEILKDSHSPYYSLLDEYRSLVKLIIKRNDNSGYFIPATLNFLAGKVVGEYLNENGLPTIYSNCLPFRNTPNYDHCILVDDFISEKINAEYLDYFSKQIQNSFHTFFDTVNYGHCLLKAKSYCEISNPIRSYVAISILQGLKQMVIAKGIDETMQIRLKEQYQDLSIRANAIDSVFRK